MNTIVQRPASVPPETWERASWYARLRYVNARNATRVSADLDGIAYHCTSTHYVTRVEQLLAAGVTTPAGIMQALDRTEATIKRRLKAAGRRDLIVRVWPDMRRTSPTLGASHVHK